MNILYTTNYLNIKNDILKTFNYKKMSKLQSKRSELLKQNDDLILEIDLFCEKKIYVDNKNKVKHANQLSQNDFNTIRNNMIIEITKIRNFNLQNIDHCFINCIFIPMNFRVIRCVEHEYHDNFGTLIILNNKINPSIINEIKRFFQHIWNTNNRYYSSEFHFETYKVSKKKI